VRRVHRGHGCENFHEDGAERLRPSHRHLRARVMRAQSQWNGVSEYGTVTGRVVDTDSLQPIPGATISIGNIVSITAAIDQGGFVLRNVPVGTQTLSISAIGWKSYKGRSR